MEDAAIDTTAEAPAQEAEAGTSLDDLAEAAEGAANDNGEEEAEEQAAEVEGEEAAPEEEEAPALELPSVLDPEDLPEALKDLKVKLKINGQEEEVPLQKALKSSRRYKAATQKEVAAARERKQVEQMLRDFDSNPGKYAAKASPEAVEQTLDTLINHPDANVQRAVDRFFTRLNEEMQMDPTAREKRRIEREREDLERQRRELEEARGERKADAESQEIVKRWEAEKAQAMKAVGLPESERFHRRMISVAREYASEGLELDKDITWQQVAEDVREELEEASRALYGDADPDTVAKMLGEERVKQLAQTQAQKVKRLQSKPRKAQKSAPKPAKDEPEMISTDALRERWGLR